MSNVDTLKKFGDFPSPTIQSDADPVHCCLEGSYLNCPENPMKGDKSMCINFMAQRCARNWDSMCDMYLVQQDEKNISGKYSNEFLTKVAESKYCRDDTSNPNSHCITSCELLNPTSTDGAITCRSVGETIYRDKNQFYNISTNFAQNQGLDTTAGLKVAGCPKVCDVFSLSALDNNDRVLNECLDRGACQNIMMDLAMKAKANNIPITNTRLLNFMNYYILQNPSTQLSQAASLGGNAPTITTQQMTIPGPVVQMAKQATNLATPTNTGVPTERFNYTQPQNINMPSKEKFSLRRNTTPKSSIVAGVLIVFYVVIGFFYLAEYEDRSPKGIQAVLYTFFTFVHKMIYYGGYFAIQLIGAIIGIFLGK
jgi:hypothetical protein